MLNTFSLGNSNSATADVSKKRVKSQPVWPRGIFVVVLTVDDDIRRKP